MPNRTCKNLIFALILSCLLCSTGAALSAPDPTYLFSWGRHAEKVPGAIGISSGIAVDSSSGDVYNTDRDFARIQRFDANGNFLAEWNCRECIGLDVNTTTHNIYTGKINEHVIIEYSPDGAEIRRWGSLGTADGQFNKPRNVAVDSATGNVYVMDILNARVQVFDGNGNFLRKWGSKGTEDGQFSGKSGVGSLAFDPATRKIYVSDPFQNSVQAFDEYGNFLWKWTKTWGNSEDQLRWIRDIEIGVEGNIYLADSDNERIQIFTPQGGSLGTFNGPHDIANGPFHPRSIAVNRTTGEKYVSAAYAHRVDKFAADDLYVKSWGGRETDAEVLFNPRGITVSPTSGDIYIMDTKNFMVKRFSSRGVFKTQWGASSRLGATGGGGWGESLFGFDDNAITTDWLGNVWVAGALTTYGDPLARFVQQFTPDGVFIANWPAADPQANRNRGITADSTMRQLYISESSRNRVRIYDTNGGVLGDIAGLGSPAGLVLDEGYLYVADSKCQCILKYDSAGGLIGQWGNAGSDPGQFNLSPVSGIATDLTGNVYVADTGNSRIQVFDPEGSFIRQIGGAGSGTGQFNRPASISISQPYDGLYVIDTYNCRVQAFLLNSVPTPDLQGKPAYFPGSGRKVYLWKDYFDDPYHLRLTGNGIDSTSYDIKLVTSNGVGSIQAVGLEADDVLAIQPSGLAFSGTITASEDGLDFDLPPRAIGMLSIELDGAPDPRQLKVGNNALPLSPLGWILPYSNLPQRPAFQGGSDLGLFIGKGASDGLLEARWNGDGNVHPAELSLLASNVFLSSNGIQLESNDQITIDTASMLQIKGPVSTWWDGADVTVTSDSNIGIAYRQDEMSGTLFTNFGDGSLGLPNTYWLPLMEPYEKPIYTPATDTGIFLWKDEADNTWHLRATAGGGNARYIGSISSDMPAVLVQAFKLETEYNDVLDTSDPTNIIFDIRMSNIWQDGIDFQFPDGATITLDLQTPENAAAFVYVGNNRWPVKQLPLQFGGW